MRRLCLHRGKNVPRSEICFNRVLVKCLFVFRIDDFLSCLAVYQPVRGINYKTTFQILTMATNINNNTPCESSTKGTETELSLVQDKSYADLDSKEEGNAVFAAPETHHVSTPCINFPEFPILESDIPEDYSSKEFQDFVVTMWNKIQRDRPTSSKGWDLDGSVSADILEKIVSRHPILKKAELLTMVLSEFSHPTLVRCRCSGFSGPKSPRWKVHHRPIPLKTEEQKQACLNYVWTIIDSLTTSSMHKINDCIKILVRHDVIDADYLKSNRDYLCFELFDKAFDELTAIPKMDVIPTMLFGKGVLQSTQSSFAALTDTLEKAVGEGIEIPSIDRLADRMENITVNTPDVKHLSDTLKGGVDVKHEHSLNPSFLTSAWNMISSLNPLSGFSSLIEKFPEGAAKDGVILLAVASLESVRINLAPKNKWYNLLAFAAMGLSFMSTNSIVRNFTITYYGITVIKKLWNWYKSSSEESESDIEDKEEEETLPVLGLNTSIPNLVDAFLATLVSLVTGITSVLTLRNVAASLVLYKTLMNGATFAADSLINLALDFMNLLGKPFGCQLFKSAYTKYPEIYAVLTTLNSIKDKGVEGKPITKDDIENFHQARSIIRHLEVRIPINSENSVYRNAISHLNKLHEAIDKVLRAKGLLVASRRKTSLCLTLLGGPGTNKTNIAHTLADIRILHVHGEEFYKKYKQSEKLYNYSMKCAQKYFDGMSNTVINLFLDDFAQSKKVNDPEHCPNLKLVDYINPEPCVLPCAVAEDKNTLFLNQDNTYITSNRKKYEDDESWATDKEAPIRRMESAFGCCFTIDPRSQYKIQGSGNAWGYRATAALLSKTHFDPDAFIVRCHDYRTGNCILDDPDLSEKDKEKFKDRTWSEFVVYFNKVADDHDANEALKLAANFHCALDPSINPMLQNMDIEALKSLKTWSSSAINALPRMDINQPEYLNPTLPVRGKYGRPAFLAKEQNYQREVAMVDEALDDADFDEMDEETMREVLKASRRARNTIISRKPRDKFDNAADFAEHLWLTHEAAVKSYYARGHLYFGNYVAQIAWGQLNNQRWADFAAAEEVRLEELLRPKTQSIWNGILGGQFIKQMYVNISPLELKSLFYKCVYMGLDIADNMLDLMHVYSCGLSDIFDAFKAGGLTSQMFWDSTKDSIKAILSATYIVSLQNTSMLATNFFSFRSTALDLLITYVPIVIASVLAVQTAVPQGDYNRPGKLIKDPLAGKCKDTKLPKKGCACTKCKVLRDKSQQDKLEKVELAMPKSHILKDNTKDCSIAVSKRNVWRCCFYEFRTKEGECVNYLGGINFTAIHSQLLVTNDHIGEAIVTKAKTTCPGMIARFTNTQVVKPFEVYARTMKLESLPNSDKLYWINDDLCSFGGGIRNIKHLFRSEKDPLVTEGILCLTTFDRTKNLTEMEWIPAILGQQYVKYTSDASPDGIAGEGARTYNHKVYTTAVASKTGACGAPVFTNCSAYKTPKIFGIICAGNSSTQASATYIVGITREEIDMIEARHHLQAYDTSNLPNDVASSTAIPLGFTVVKVEPDDHTLNPNNTIVKTEYYGCIGESNRIPTFLAPWERDSDGLIVDPDFNARQKKVTPSPAINPDIMKISVAMLALRVDSLLPEGPRAYRLTTEQALNGDMGEAPFSCRTSPGGSYILQGIKKKDIVRRDENDQLDFSSEAGQLFLDNVEKATYERENRIISLSIVNEFGKAETGDATKIANGKGRIVCGDDSHEVIADKKELACLNRLLKEAPITTGLCIGFDPNTTDAHVMISMLRIWNRIDSIDVSNFDGTYFRFVYQAVFLFISLVLYDAEPLHLVAIRTSMENMLYRIHMAHITYNSQERVFMKVRVFYEWVHGMISGAYGTLMFNTIGLALLDRYMKLCLFIEENGQDFRLYDPFKHGELPFRELEANIISFGLGDDLVSSIHNGLSYMGFEKLQAMYLWHYIKITTDAKDGVYDGFASIGEKDPTPSLVGFCKRRAAWREEIQRYVLMLDIESLKNMIYYSENFDEHDQVIDGFFKELSAHGRKVFEENKRPVDTISRLKYGYTSPYSIYELALVALLTGGKQKDAREHYIAICDGTLDPQEVLISSGGFSPYPITNVGDPLMNSLTHEDYNQASKHNNNKIEKRMDESVPEEKTNVGVSSSVNKPTTIVVPLMEAPITQENFATTTMSNQAEGDTTSFPASGDKSDGFSHSFTSLSDFLRRPVLIESGDWGTESQNADLLSFAIGTELLAAQPWSDKFSGYNGIRATAVIELQINANAFEQGMLLMHFIPQFSEKSYSTSSNKLLIQKTQHPGVELDCRQSSATLRVPYVSPGNYFDISTQTYDWGKVFLTVLSKLKTGAAATSTTVQYSIWLHFEDVEVAIPIPAVPHSDAEKSVMSNRSVSEGLSAAGKIAGMLGTAPGLSQYSTSLKWSLETAARFAHTLGYSKPSLESAPTTVLKQLNRYSATSDGPDVALPVALSSQNQVTTITTASVRREDEMAIDFIKKIWCLYDTHNWTVSQAVGSFYSIALAANNIRESTSVVYGAKTVTYQACAPCSHIAKLFTYTRGGYEIRVKIPKCDMISGRLEIVCNPKTLTLGTSTDNTLAMRHIVDLQFGSEFVFKIPYLVTDPYINTSEVMATIYFNVLNKLKAPDACALNVDILTFVRCLDDWEVAGVIPELPLPPVIVLPAGEVISNVTFGNQKTPSLNTKHAEVSIGEMCTSVKQLLLRYNSIPATTLATVSQAVNPYFLGVLSFNGTTGAKLNPVYGGDIFSWIGCCYNGMRGGMRISQTAYRNPASGYTPNWIVSLTPKNALAGSNWCNAAVAPAITAYDWTLQPSAATNYTSNIGVTHCEDVTCYAQVPYYCRTMYSLCNATVSDTASVASDAPTAIVNMYLSNPGPAVSFGLGRAVCDDFRFHYWISTPLILISYV